MKRLINQQKGFTLIEMIAVLVLVGIMAVFAGFGIITAVNGYMFSKNNVTISGKAQLAMARINRELLECYNCSVTSNPNLGTTPFSFVNTLGQRYIRLTNAGNIEISPDNFTNTDILIDNVNSFAIAYSSTGDKSIIVTMSLNHPDSATPIVFSTNVYPRSTN